MWEKKEPFKQQPSVDTGARNTSRETTSQVSLGKSIVIKGEVSGHEDLTIDGSVEGKISLQEHNLTVGAHGSVDGEVVAKRVIVMGKVTGNVCATEKVDILEGGRLDGDILSPRLSIADGAHFRGKVDMDVASAGRKEGGTVSSVAETARA